MKYLTIAVLGHINHGKTSLINSLTGINTDTRKDEQERGMTIDAGFAYLKKNNSIISFTDVPGHEKFSKNMLSVINSIDCFIICISAIEAIMPQTEEHLEIMRLLEVKKCIIIITKFDLVDNFNQITKLEQNHIVNTQGTKAPLFRKFDFDKNAKEFMFEYNNEKTILEYFKKIAYFDYDLFYFSTKEKKYSENIINYLLSLDIKEKKVKNDVIFPIDRVFTKQGIGTIITGNLYSGEINKDDILKIFPLNKEVRIKKIETHNEIVNKIKIGYRAGINLNINHNEINKGDILVLNYKETNCIYITFNKSILLEKKIKNNDRIRLYYYSCESFGKIIFLDLKSSENTNIIFAKIVLEKKIFITKETKIIIKNFSPIYLIGSGIVIKEEDFDKKLKTEIKVKLLIFYEKNDYINIINEYLLLNKESFLKEDNLKKIIPNYFYQENLKKLEEFNLIFRKNFGIIKKTYYFDCLEKIFLIIKEAKELVSKNYISKITLFNSEMIDIILKELFNYKKISFYDNNYFIKEEDLTKDEKKLYDFLIEKKFIFLNEILKEDDFKKVNTINLIKSLLFKNKIVKITDDFFISDIIWNECLEKTKDSIKSLGKITPTELKEILNTTRKYIMPILEYMDKIKFTKRDGNYRVLFKV
ncbi:MAG: SelB C-terminal domain-containing protein [Cyanobacteriota bacterium]